MAKTVEDRIEALERFRYSAIGRLNACQTLVLNAMLNVILQGSDDPVATAEDIRKKLLAGAGTPHIVIRSMHPAELDAISQEYESALDELTRRLLATVRGSVSRKGNRPRKRT